MTITRTSLLLSLLVLCSSHVRADAGAEVFLLTVTLRDPYNPRLVLGLPVIVGRPFSVSFTNGPIVTTVSGTLGPEVGGKHAVPLKISEGAGAHPGYSVSGTYPLRLGKPEGQQTIAGQTIFSRTLLLARLGVAQTPKARAGRRRQEWPRGQTAA